MDVTDDGAQMPTIPIPIPIPILMMLVMATMMN